MSALFLLPDKVVELIDLLLVVVRQRVLLALLAFDEGRFHLRSVYLRIAYLGPSKTSCVPP